MTYLYAGLGMAMLTAIMAMFEMATSFVGASVSMKLSYDELLYFKDGGQARDIDRAMLCLGLEPPGCNGSLGFYGWDKSEKGDACAAQAAKMGNPDDARAKFNVCRCQSFESMLASQAPTFSYYAFTPGSGDVVCQASSVYEPPDLKIRLNHRLRVVQRGATYSFYSCVRPAGLLDSERDCWHET